MNRYQYQPDTAAQACRPSRAIQSLPTPRPRLRPVSAPQSPVSDGDLAEAEAAADAAARALEAPAPALALEARPEPAAANQTPRASRSERRSGARDPNRPSSRSRRSPIAAMSTSCVAPCLARSPSTIASIPTPWS